MSEWSADGRTLRSGVWLLTLALALALGVVGSRWLVTQLPAGDTGIPENWFPATAWMLVVFAVLARSGVLTTGDRLIAAVALVVSGCFGAGLYGYVDWMTPRASWATPVAGVVAAALTLEGLLSYRFRLSPMSSIASPTLRRPRPNPS